MSFWTVLETLLEIAPKVVDTVRKIARSKTPDPMPVRVRPHLVPYDGRVCIFCREYIASEDFGKPCPARSWGVAPRR